MHMHDCVGGGKRESVVLKLAKGSGGAFGAHRTKAKNKKNGETATLLLKYFKYLSEIVGK